MECLFRFVSSPAPPQATSIVPPPPPFLQNNKRNRCIIKAQISDDNDPLLQSAINSASLRFHETHGRDPLFVDPYSGCFVSPHIRMDVENRSKHYCLATKFIDDKLLRTVNHMDGLKQVVLLSDGMDTRPYRLNWPSSTIIFDISPQRVFQKAIEKLKGVGAKIPRRCLFLHVPFESSNIQETLIKKGFNGNRPSIWAIQGLPVMTLASFKEILLTVGGMATNGCLFLGELPAWLAETEFENKSGTRNWMENLFSSKGFKVDMIRYDEVAKRLGKVVKPGDYNNILFVAEQMRFSDDQEVAELSKKEDSELLQPSMEMETWRRELQRVDDDGDEEGFEDLKM